MINPLDLTARPRISLIWPGESDAVTAVALRTVELCLLGRLPAARVELFGAAASKSKGARPVRKARWVDIAANDVQHRLAADSELLVVLQPPDPSVSASLEAAGRSQGTEVLHVAEPELCIVHIAARAQEEWFAENRRGFLRALGWLPADRDVPYIVTDSDPSLAQEVGAMLASDPALNAVVLVPSSAPAQAGPDLLRLLPSGRAHCLDTSVGVDEVVAALATARRYLGTDPMAGAIVQGIAEPSAEATSVERRIAAAARAALSTWEVRGRPGRGPDPAASRRAGTERALARCELIAARQAADEANAQLGAVVGSRSWRFTAWLRAGRRRIAL